MNCQSKLAQQSLGFVVIYSLSKISRVSNHTSKRTPTRHREVKSPTDQLEKSIGRTERRTFGSPCNSISELSYCISEGLIGLDKGMACLDLKAIKCN